MGLSVLNPMVLINPPLRELKGGVVISSWNVTYT
jgi:hypothetical protein